MGYCYGLDDNSPSLLVLPLALKKAGVLAENGGNSGRLKKGVVIKVERRGAIVMASLKSSMTVFHVTNALQSRVAVLLLGLFVL